MNPKQLLILPTVALFLIAGAEDPKEPSYRERIEWCDIWVTNADADDKPRVLLIGDSITRGYFGRVEKAVGVGANCARLTTSKCFGDPALLMEVELVLKQYPFKVIHFNNGIHGRQYTEDQYRKGFEAFLALVKKHASEAGLIWASTTPVRNKEALDEFDPYTERISARNDIAAALIKPLGIATNDLFAIGVKHSEYFRNDGVHFNQEGISAQAEIVAASIKELLQNQGS